MPLLVRIQILVSPRLLGCILTDVLVLIKVAKYREAHSLPALQTFVIDVISSSDAKLEHDDIEMLKQTKMSSTFIREWIAAKKSPKQ